MRQHRLVRTMALLIAGVLVLAGLAGCATDGSGADPAPAASVVETGTLSFVADGEEHAREGTTSKEGWEITFEHAYVTLTGITAYQTDPPYDVDADAWDIDPLHSVTLPDEFTVDLAAPASDPASVGEVGDAVAGHYNALAWDLVRASSGPAEGLSMLFVGTAERDGERVDFTLRFDREVTYLGGEYIGDVRKGILEAGSEAEMEMTFHFDHFFGRDDKDADDPMNIDALGFDPLAALATDGVLDVSMSDLEELLPAEEYAKLEAILVHFGHVGEGHCIARPLD